MVRKIKTRLSWRDYFYQFIEVHGEPIISDGVLLFRDGWTYSLTSYNGPEWSPPTDRRKLKRLKEIYWTEMRSRYQRELQEVRYEILGIREWSQVKSLPIRQRVWVSNEDGGGRTVYSNADTTILDHQVEDLRHLIAECEKQLEDLE